MSANGVNCRQGIGRCAVHLDLGIILENGVPYTVGVGGVTDADVAGVLHREVQGGAPGCDRVWI